MSRQKLDDQARAVIVAIWIGLSIALASSPHSVMFIVWVAGGLVITGFCLGVIWEKALTLWGRGKAQGIPFSQIGELEIDYASANRERSPLAETVIETIDGVIKRYRHP